MVVESKQVGAPQVLSVARIATLVGSIVVALCSGTNYVRPTVINVLVWLF